jgi:hypothetical protein
MRWVVKLARMGDRGSTYRVDNVARMGDRGSTYRVLVTGLEGTTTLKIWRT